MKYRIQIHQIIVVCAMALSVAVACNRVIEEPSVSGTQMASFRAIIEGNGPETKTVLGEKNIDGYYPVYWSEGDKIKIVTNSYNCSDGQGTVMELVSGAGTKEAIFNGEIPVLTESAPYYYAIFPDHISASIGEEHDGYNHRNEVEIVLPSIQQYEPHSFGRNCNPAVAMSDNEVLRFKNVCGLLQINLTGDIKVGKITVENKGLAPLWGTLKFGYDYDGGNHSIGMQWCDLHWGNSTGMRQSTLTLDCGEGVQLSDDPTDFYLAIPYYDWTVWYGQGNYDPTDTPLSEGFIMRVYDETGKEVYTKVTEQDNVMARAMVTEMPLIDIRAKELEDLSAIETANCYIVKPNSSYRFYAGYRGCSTYPVPLGKEIAVLWETQNSDEEPGIRGIIQSGYYYDDTGYVTFTTTGNSGNALLALKDQADNVLWSWHIWVTDYDPEQIEGQEKFGDLIFMDRELGSIGANDAGLQYEWGRKDPFFDFASSPAEPFNNETDLTGDDFLISDYGIAHPTTYITSIHSGWAGPIWLDYFLWGKEKTMYDPCPPGWQVCDHEVIYESDFNAFPNPVWTNWHASHGYGGAYVVHYKHADNHIDEWGPATKSGVRCQKSTTIQHREEIDLSQNGTANCYIVEPGKDYKFKATVKGNSSESTGAIAYVEKGYYTVNSNWINAETMMTDKDLVSNLAIEDGYIHFQTFKSNPCGNETILVKDLHGNVLWSWHIWCPEINPEENTYLFDGGDNVTYEMMPLNLGALNNTPGTSGSLGLMYQWGRKDPFLGARVSGSSSQAEYHGDHGNVDASEQTSTLEYAISHPTQFIGSPANWLSEADNGLWGPVKTKYDPCPPGWKVPSRPLWSSTPAVSATFDADNKGLRMDGQWYPAAGYRNKTSFSLHDVGLDGHYWYASSHNDDTAHALLFMHTSNDTTVIDLNSYTDSKAQANSVRCVKDE